MEAVRKSKSTYFANDDRSPVSSQTLPALQILSQSPLVLEGHWTRLLSEYFVSFMYSITEAGRNLWRPPTANPLLKTGTARAGCSGPFPVGF